MNRLALTHEVKQLGKRLPNTETHAVDRLQDLTLPVLIVVGTQDTPYALAAAEYMQEHIKGAKKVTISNAAHLPNMEHPDEFQGIVRDFLAGISS
jgi:pimeloyl-ACP methyl ester carboxylesterase